MSGPGALTRRRGIFQVRLIVGPIGSGATFAARSPQALDPLPELARVEQQPPGGRWYGISPRSTRL